MKQLAAISRLDLATVTGGANLPGDRPFDPNRDGQGRVVDHNNGQHVGGPSMNPAKTVDFIPLQPGGESRN